MHTLKVQHGDFKGLPTTDTSNRTITHHDLTTTTTNTTSYTITPQRLRLCLVPVKYFPENIYFLEMLFSGKKNVFKLFGCLKIRFTENQFWCLARSNIFTENALHSQATQFSIHFLSCKHVDNESIPHSFTKETKPSKKRKSNPVKLRSRGRGEGEIGGEIKWRDRS